MSRLALFELEAPPPPRLDLTARVRAAMGHNFGNFHWWCNSASVEVRAHCEAGLWRQYGFSEQEARLAVNELAKPEPGVMWPHPTPEGAR